MILSQKIREKERKDLILPKRIAKKCEIFPRNGLNFNVINQGTTRSDCQSRPIECWGSRFRCADPIQKILDPEERDIHSHRSDPTPCLVISRSFPNLECCVPVSMGWEFYDIISRIGDL